MKRGKSRLPGVTPSVAAPRTEGTRTASASAPVPAEGVGASTSPPHLCHIMPPTTATTEPTTDNHHTLPCTRRSATAPSSPFTFFPQSRSSSNTSTSTAPATPLTPMTVSPASATAATQQRHARCRCRTEAPSAYATRGVKRYVTAACVLAYLTLHLTRATLRLLPTSNFTPLPAAVRHQNSGREPASAATEAVAAAAVRRALAVKAEDTSPLAGWEPGLH
jgi:hypothetical protein